MKKFVCLAAFGLVALFVVPPAPVEARHFGRHHGWGPRVVVGWRGYRPARWSVHPRVYYRRAWRTDYCYPYAGAVYSYRTRPFYRFRR
jgi:hypothetical protein